MRNEILKELKKLTGLAEKVLEQKLETPPNPELGDYAFPCFILASKFKKSPEDIARDLSKEFKLENDISIHVNGPYLNFFINKRKFSEDIIKQILKEKDKFGKNKVGSKSVVMIEFPSPNTNKPLHLGHLRNMSIGESISRIHEFVSQKVIRGNLNNDRGVHICKSMVAYENWGKNKNPNKKSDHFVGDFYVLYNQKLKTNPKLEKQTQECLQKWEAGDKQTITIWKKMNKWALDGFKETYKKFKIKHDKEYFESKIYKGGKEVIEEGLKKGIFEKGKDGEIKINLEKENLGEKVVLRSDGTSVYITQDLYLAKLKYQEFKLTNSIYVVGNEQDYHFKVLSKILEKLDLPFKVQHLSYGMVNLPSGKMKSREGKVVDADDIIEETNKLAKKEILDREPKLNKSEVGKRAEAISLGAIKYQLLKIDSAKNILFNPEESIAFEGNTGPYIQYTYARSSSILRKIKKKIKDQKPKSIHESEIELIKEMNNFQETVESAYKHLNPALLANYSFQLAQKFNDFYQNCPVIGDENEAFRLKIVEAYKIVIKSALNLLGIDVLEEM